MISLSLDSLKRSGRRRDRSLLLRAALGPPAEAEEAFHAWRRRVRTALSDLPPADKALLPLLSSRLPGFGAPADDCDAAMNAYRATWATNHHLASEAAPAIEALQSAGLPVTALKGTVLAFGVYASPGLRPMRDVDLLVPPERSREARRALEKAGFLPVERHADGFLDSIHGIGYRSPSGFEVDLHWHALLERPEGEADRFLATGAAPLRLPDGAVLAPAPEAHLLLVSVHAERWSPVAHRIGIADIVALLGRSSPVRLQETVEAARRLGLLVPFSRALAEAEWASPGCIPSALGGMRREDPPPGERLEALLRRRPPGLLPGLALHWLAHRRSTPGETEGERLRGFPSRMRRVWSVPDGRSLLAEAFQRASGRLSRRAPS